MNENKTGVFISTLRKEKELTQAQLAEKLNVTDKAISRWETGKGMPDSSLLVPLSDILGITVNELLIGEKIPEETFIQKSEDNLIDSVHETEKAISQRNFAKRLLVVTAIVFILSVSFLTTAIYLMSTSIYEATYLYDDEGFYSGVLYGNDSYVYWHHIDNTYLESGVIENPEMHPYNLVEGVLREKIYISDNSIHDFFPPYSYFSFCGESNDFIFEQPDDSSLNLLLVKKDFQFPDIYNNEVEEVWMSLDPYDSGNITDKTKANKIVDRMINASKQGLTKEIYDYILKNSWDNCHFYLKYKGYPLVEEFCVTVTEDGRYIAVQQQ
ncbi:MAG: helix-turn-helix transcriptional regulator [Clostridia bacterium]|nr:helix-turn-helix transcriptional regulator [Clostridia bacterium]